jgi:hypothetical protein
MRCFDHVPYMLCAGKIWLTKKKRFLVLHVSHVKCSHMCQKGCNTNVILLDYSDYDNVYYIRFPSCYRHPYCVLNY